MIAVPASWPASPGGFGPRASLESTVTNHPNRSRRTDTAGRNPTPAEILEARQKADLSQEEAARLVHSVRNAWQQWEYGDRKMHPAFWELFQRKVKELGLGRSAPR